MISKFNQILDAPYPLSTSHKKGFVLTVSVSVFVSVFLCVFRPFGIGGIVSPHKYLIIASFGIPTFVITLILNQTFIFIARRWISEESWKIKHEFAVFLLYPTLIGGANFLYVQYLFGGNSEVGSLVMMMAYTAAVAFFPSLGWIMVDAVMATNRNNLIALSIPDNMKVHQSVGMTSQAPKTIELQGENKNDSIRFLTSDFLYAKAESNYVEIFLKPDEKPRSHLLRLPLKSIEHDLSGNEDILRCHRSYLVNLSHVQSAQGNAQGLFLDMGNNHKVPVSRRYVPTLRVRLAE